MKGIKECVNWLLDNQGKELKCIEDKRPGGTALNKTVKYGEYFDEEYSSDSLGIYWTENECTVSFGIFDNCKWEEVIESVLFEEAYQDCLENSKNDNLIIYKNGKSQTVLLKGMNGIVSIHINKSYGNIEIINDKWIKVVK